MCLMSSCCQLSGECHTLFLLLNNRIDSAAVYQLRKSTIMTVICAELAYTVTRPPMKPVVVFVLDTQPSMAASLVRVLH